MSDPEKMLGLKNFGSEKIEEPKQIGFGKILGQKKGGQRKFQV